MNGYVTKNLAAVNAEIRAAESLAGRQGRTKLIAAVKYASDEELRQLLAAGVLDVGENRVQQLLSHMSVYEGSGARIHFIGTLQKNKIKYIIDKVFAIHSVDSVALAREIGRHAQQRGITVRVFAEINIGREAAKGGAMPEEAQALCREIVGQPGLELVGLMTMAPKCESDTAYREYFAKTRALAEEIWQQLGLAGTPLLSMGMSESFAAAIAEGADMVRVGRRLFLQEDI